MVAGTEVAESRPYRRQGIKQRTMKTLQQRTNTQGKQRDASKREQERGDTMRKQGDFYPGYERREVKIRLNGKLLRSDVWGPPREEQKGRRNMEILTTDEWQASQPLDNCPRRGICRKEGVSHFRGYQKAQLGLPFRKAPDTPTSKNKLIGGRGWELKHI